MPDPRALFYHRKQHARAHDYLVQHNAAMSTATMTLTASDEDGKKKHTKKPLQRRDCIVPERGSLWDTMRDHQGTSLFVLPICWTDLHTRLLGCRFVRRPTPATSTQPPTSSPRRSPPRASSTVVGIGRDLETLLADQTPRNVVTKTRALRNIVSTLFPTHMCKPKSNAELSIRFGSRVYAKATRAQVIWKHPDASMSFDSATTWTSSRTPSQLLESMNVRVASDAPVLAYVSRSNLNHIRHNCFRVVPGPRMSYNGPVHRLQTLRSKNLIPSNLDEDPHFVATIIALAQQMVYADGLKGKTIAPRDVTVRLFTTSEDDKSFIIYTATVPAAFLMMFHEPEKAPKGDPALNIEYTHVPVWPVLGLKERLGEVLGKEVVGDFDPLNIETFPDEEEEIMSVAAITSPKRRREVLSEVLNVSFSEDREPNTSDGINIMGKRRCLEEGVAVVEVHSNAGQCPETLQQRGSAKWRQFATRASIEDDQENQGNEN
ncbi:hypothetical protein JX266_007392 [Neoarthrinium moseri]|nr:hypothetical protein JX266_007392 [Neoarthrinium moseri]